MSIANVLKYRILDTKEGDRVLPIYLANAAGAPVNGTSGTLAGVAPKGALLMSQEVALYQNTNTQTSPTWSQIEYQGANVLPVMTSYSAISTAPSANNVAVPAANLTGGAADVFFAYTGTAGAGFTLTTDSAANIVAAVPNAKAGQTYTLRVINEGSGQTATLTAGGSVTVTGTATIANNTWRDFVVTLTSLTAVTMQNVGVGTFS